MTRVAGFLLLALAAVSLAGCDDGVERQEPLKRQLEMAQERVMKANEEAEQARVARERDRRVLRAGEQEARANLDAVMVIWISTSTALVLTTILLAREVAARRLQTGMPEGGDQE